MNWEVKKTVGKEKRHTVKLVAWVQGAAAGEKREEERRYATATQEIKRCGEVAGKSRARERDSKGASVCVSNTGGRERQSHVMQSHLEGLFLNNIVKEKVSLFSILELDGNQLRILSTSF